MSLPNDWNHGGGAQVPGYESPSLRDLLNGITGLTLAEARALPAAQRSEAPLLIDGAWWRWDAGCELDGDDALVVEPDDEPAAGRFLRLPGSALLSLPFTFATADATVLLTVPAGCWLRIAEPFWSVSTGFTGGTSSAIGVSSNKSGYSTKGDLLGGASGDVAATLVASSPVVPIMGTIGAGYDTLAKRRTIFKPGDTIRFDRITSAFTAGVGAVNLVVDVLKNDGA